MIAAMIMATPVLPFLISSHSSMGVSEENTLTKILKATAMETAPVRAQPKVMRYCFKMYNIKIIYDATRFCIW